MSRTAVSTNIKFCYAQIMENNFAYYRAQSASNLDWSRIRYFQKDEFPEEEIEFLNKYVIEELDKLRDVLVTPIKISPAKGAVVRFPQTEGGQPTSWHDSCEARKLGQAIDIFIPDTHKLFCVDLLIKVFGNTRFRGVGFYFDTSYEGQPTIMLHLDLRHRPTLWYCPKRSENTRRDYNFSTNKANFLTELEKNWLDFHHENLLKNV